MIVAMTSGEDALHWSLSDFYEMDEPDIVEWYAAHESVGQARNEARKNALSRTQKRR